MSHKLHVIGLTGGIATGKSVVADTFRQLDIPVINADDLGKMALEPGMPAYQSVISEFGTEILTVDREHIDRKRLGAKIFNNDAARKKLEEITHPAINQLARQAMSLVEQKGNPFAVYEAALLVETGMNQGMDALVVTTCSLANQLIRLCQRDGLDKTDAATRIACQMPTADKVAVADYVIDNDGTTGELIKTATTVGRQLIERFG